MSNASYRILVVDDDDGDRKLIRRYLAKTPGLKVLEASGAEKALEYRSESIDAVFLDHLLPGASGLDLISTFSEAWPSAAIILVTGQGNEELAKNAILKGATDYIAKAAITEPALKRMIENGVRVARMRQKLEAQQQELSLFSDVLVHDLRAPVRAIQFLCDEITEDFAAGNMQEVRREFDLVQRSAQRLTEMIDSLATHVDLNKNLMSQEVEVGEIFERVQMALARDIADSGAQISWQGRDLRINCVVPQIAQLLQNLVANSIKYAGNKEPVIRVAAEHSGDKTRCQVADNGIGVPEEYREKIFEPFKRLQVTKELPGSGLGLATCKKIVQRHGGEIWCDQGVQSGTIINFTLAEGANLAAFQNSDPGILQ